MVKIENFISTVEQGSNAHLFTTCETDGVIEFISAIWYKMIQVLSDTALKVHMKIKQRYNKVWALFLDFIIDIFCDLIMFKFERNFLFLMITSSSDCVSFGAIFKVGILNSGRFWFK